MTVVFFGSMWVDVPLKLCVKLGITRGQRINEAQYVRICMEGMA